MMEDGDHKSLTPSIMEDIILAYLSLGIENHRHQEKPELNGVRSKNPEIFASIIH
jgi:hypothetical protein